jgi:hypothetical protein
MERRYQIFVSSTFSDLTAERQAVMQALLNLNHFPAGMELFPASNEDQWALIKGVIDDSDYYLLVIGGRYGSTTEVGISFTEKEFDYAVEAGIPILAFIHEDPGSLPAKKTDQNDAARAKLDAFREKVKAGRHIKFWSTPENLETRVTQAVSAETKRNPREGWVRGNFSSDPTKLNELREEISQLKAALARARTQPPTGSEAYAQGSESFTVIVQHRKDYGDSWDNTDVQLTWDDIFYELGPLLFNEASEQQLRNRLTEQILMYDDDFIRKSPKYHRIYVDSFETIKIQLVALGLMQKSDRKHPPSDTATYWQATPYGEQYVMKLRALKKGEKKEYRNDD